MKRALPCMLSGLLAALLIGGGPVRAADSDGAVDSDGTVAVSAELSAAEIPFHHVARYRIAVEAPRDAAIEIAPWADAMPGLEIRREAPAAHLSGPGRQIFTQDFTLIPSLVRAYELPELLVLVNSARHTEVPPRHLEVRELTPEEREAAQRLHPVVTLAEAEGRDAAPLSGYALAAGLLCIVLIAAAWRWWPRNVLEDARSPWEIAEGDLRQLLAALEARRIRGEEFYVALSNILRDYLEARYGLAAREHSTPELARQLLDGDTLELHLSEEVLGLLRDVDRVKFAQRRPSIAQMAAEAGRASDFVAATRPDLAALSKTETAGAAP